jgi:hypothetical protein
VYRNQCSIGLTQLFKFSFLYGTNFCPVCINLHQALALPVLAGVPELFCRTSNDDVKKTRLWYHFHAAPKSSSGRKPITTIARIYHDPDDIAKSPASVLSSWPC